jgi:hypothetical protein
MKNYIDVKNSEKALTKFVTYVIKLPFAPVQRYGIRPISNF